MILVKIKRVVKSGASAFWRNPIVSLAAGLVMTVTLFMLGSLLLGSALLDSSLSQIKDKVDVNVYFRLDAEEEDVLVLAEALRGLPEVASVEYVSREQALENFKERHKDNSLIVASLEELDDNPLGAALNVKAREPSQYVSVANFLDESAALGSGGVSIIDKVNFNQNKVAIDKLSEIISAVERFGSFLILILAVIALLVTFNTIRLAIYTARDEVAVMKLVGASNNYVSGPFLVTGALYGALSAVLSTILLWPLAGWVSKTTGNFFGAIDLSSYFVSNLLQIFLLLLVAGIILGTISSIMAVRRYLKV
ncbi:MAG: hypothetical protein COV07_03455 [Candidatus Vogelbacteria bacterium CG10_big_fil_rev_8_21_14_0_10_45_14]|uniref:Cell division protein FtsX n=1 Tax=Candidatus Vogelbacteria bacterium CG10_big_fil_rev_8_21_14_0_10_45_14 TaxID=1975042 RepID=A0A2H0RJJ1_9BACT|nr:MAG: hypothetical protein COV07_03455 [Candidatus Vogelbacteria bacterium CG10_big_fil_rev_8_21_14_0_10_45_14]